MEKDIILTHFQERTQHSLLKEVDTRVWGQNVLTNQPCGDEEHCPLHHARAGLETKAGPHQ